MQRRHHDRCGGTRGNRRHLPRVCRRPMTHPQPPGSGSHDQPISGIRSSSLSNVIG
jgi:hypothetical protein